VRAPRPPPPGEGPRHGPGGDHLPEPRLRGGSRLGGDGGLRGKPPQPQRRDVGRHEAPRAARLLRPVYSGSVARAARRRLSVRSVRHADGRRRPSVPKYLISYRKTDEAGQKPEWASFTTD